MCLCHQLDLKCEDQHRHEGLCCDCQCIVCRYKLPKELSEFKLVCAAVQKPLFLLALLHTLQGQSVIVFTASVEATHRSEPLHPVIQAL